MTIVLKAPLLGAFIMTLAIILSTEVRSMDFDPDFCLETDSLADDEEHISHLTPEDFPKYFKDKANQTNGQELGSGTCGYSWERLNDLDSTTKLERDATFQDPFFVNNWDCNYIDVNLKGEWTHPNGLILEFNEDGTFTETLLYSGTI